MIPLTLPKNESRFYVPFNALLGYIRTATSEGMKRNFRRDEKKDGIPFGHILAGYEPTLASDPRFRGQRR